ncbi:Sorcin, putative [Entamoeba dispar SAW760]|uniref:Sorcin, putative n=1 Tax=Entamoeba dispar (strain ATCC PRA-260 / SAW760) TaxID=370354 RepID=B0EJ45_ENTDS|nr:Sorcin, putative [Entamoeba dispar SAW760]EDR25450.1 Sorcin, putative [Entamoeba dispar SAW760]|eukprot:EDR25450.1 Sorcin, putative [Entamoeba dispar SAW760]
MSLRIEEFRPLQEWFEKTDKDKSGTLELNELKSAKFPGGLRLDEDTCRKLMKIFDMDLSGNIGFYEYLALMKFVDLVDKTFIHFDADHSGTMDLNEMMAALPQLGFDITRKNCEALIRANARGLFSKKIKRSQFVGCVSFLGLIRSIYQKTMNVKNDDFKREDFSRFMNLVLLICDEL